MSNTITPEANMAVFAYDAVKLERKAAIFKALGHPIRLRIVHMLMDGERCVCTLHADSQRDMSTISSHLKVLRNAQVIKSRQVGKQVFYSLNICCLPTLLKCLDTCVENNPFPQ